MFDSEKCNCDNILKENELEENMCFKKCQNGDEQMSCGGDETESIFETGSKVPGPVKFLSIQEATEDKLTISWDSPERNGTELTGFEIEAFVIFFNYKYF